MPQSKNKRRRGKKRGQSKKMDNDSLRARVRKYIPEAYVDDQPRSREEVTIDSYTQLMQSDKGREMLASRGITEPTSEELIGMGMNREEYIAYVHQLLYGSSIRPARGIIDR